MVGGVAGIEGSSLKRGVGHSQQSNKRKFFPRSLLCRLEVS